MVNIFGVLALVGISGLSLISGVLVVMVTVQAVRERDIILLAIVSLGVMAIVGAVGLGTVA